MRMPSRILVFYEMGCSKFFWVHFLGDIGTYNSGADGVAWLQEPV